MTHVQKTHIGAASSCTCSHVESHLEAYHVISNSLARILLARSSFCCLLAAHSRARSCVEVDGGTRALWSDALCMSTSVDSQPLHTCLFHEVTLAWRCSGECVNGV